MRWTDQEIAILKNRDLTHKELHILLPHRSIEGIRRKTYQFGLQRTLRRFGHITQAEAEEIWSNLELQQLIEGHLLGDGCVAKEGNFRLGTNNQDYASFTQSCLNKLTNKKSKSTYYPSVLKTWKTGEFTSKESWSVNCVCSKIFKPQRKRWYPEGVKIVPEDFELTPLSCNRWYCDDGYLSVVPKHSICTVTLCTDSFTLLEVDFLRNQISDKIGIETGTRKIKKKFLRIVIYSPKRVVKFLEYIGPCPVDSFQYKWKLK